VDEPGTGRLETFSDGVFAIAATLLVLEFSITSTGNLGDKLAHLWPSYLAYVTSFLTIGIIWMNHHHTVSLFGRIDRTSSSSTTSSCSPSPSCRSRRSSSERPSSRGTASRLPRSRTPGRWS